mmetsp:Transcript_43606/g.79456  ORF Transcript_43606/g.79456 Transcript_43606/m.79456 type:complete len:385 (+) Transcript_43606:114-1268(+)
MKLPTMLLGALPSSWTKGSNDSEQGREGRRSPSNSNPVAPPQQDKTAEMSVDMLNSALEEAIDVKPWETANLEFVKLLQDAIRNHGRVDLMKRLDSGSMVAVKKMPNRWVTAGPKEFAEQYPTATERPWLDIGIVRYLNRLEFPYACELYDVFRDTGFTYVAVSLATEGDLFTWCNKDQKPCKENEAELRPIARQIMEAVRWLHNLGISHRDLSLENILLTNSGDGLLHIKVIDFGMATTRRKCVKEVRGKQSYQAPEMHGETAYDAFLTDAFAIGVIIFGVAAQDYPWITTKRGLCRLYDYISMHGLRSFMERRKVRKGDGECLIEVLSEGLIDVLEGFLQLQAEQRLTLGEKCWGKERVSAWNLPWVKDGALDPRYEKIVGG